MKTVDHWLRVLETAPFGKTLIEVHEPVLRAFILLVQQDAKMSGIIEELDAQRTFSQTRIDALKECTERMSSELKARTGG